MEFSAEQARPVVLRMKRAHGHLARVIRMLEEGSDCEAVLTQLAAVNKALSRSAYALVASGLQRCLTEGDPDGEVDLQKMEKLFLALA